ncbi:hypothetical protein TRVL_07462 [Trypanosoma vivax]|nr:hypothetical protein TRVL_07462 [Trypanosoma vivax]
MSYHKRKAHQKALSLSLGGDAALACRRHVLYECWFCGGIACEDGAENTQTTPRPPMKRDGSEFVSIYSSKVLVPDSISSESAPICDHLHAYCIRVTPAS